MNDKEASLKLNAIKAIIKKDLRTKKGKRTEVIRQNLTETHLIN